MLSARSCAVGLAYKDRSVSRLRAERHLVGDRRKSIMRSESNICVVEETRFVGVLQRIVVEENASVASSTSSHAALPTATGPDRRGEKAHRGLVVGALQNLAHVVACDADGPAIAERSALQVGLRALAFTRGTQLAAHAAGRTGDPTEKPQEQHEQRQQERPSQRPVEQS
jgi:hypothetical protein